MKYFWTLSLFTILLAACQVSDAKTEKVLDNPFPLGLYDSLDQEIDGMKYRIWYKVWSGSQAGYCITTVNLTKDKLECDLLRKQIEQKRN